MPGNPHWEAEVKTGVWQGYLASPIMFFIVPDWIMRNDKTGLDRDTVVSHTEVERP